MRSLADIAARGLLSLEQLTQIEDSLLVTDALAQAQVRRQIAWFVEELGIDSYYFQTTPVEEIARHVLLLGASELTARHGGDGVAIQLLNEQQDRAIYIVENRTHRKLEVERRIEKRYPAFRLESYTTTGSANGTALRFYIATRPRYGTDGGSDGAQDAVRFEDAATRDFLERSMEETLERYRLVWEELHQRLTPVVRISRKDETGEIRIMVGLQAGGFRQMLTGFSHLFHRIEIPVQRKYIEPFSDGTFLLSFYIKDTDDGTLRELERELNMVAILPRGTITTLFTEESFSAQETMYAVAAAAFTHQFVSERAEGYSILEETVEHHMEARGILDSMRRHLAKNTFSTRRISATVLENREAVRQLFRHFEALHAPAAPGRKKKRQVPDRKEAEQMLERDVPYHRDRTILASFLAFNELVQYTNFFRDRKACVAFRLRQGFLDPQDYPEEPYGVFFLVGRQFIGFHVRFRDIARGGIRIVRSRTADAYARNIDTLFQENYNLAYTQQKKNKDIPEGGSKGMVLLNQEFHSDPAAAPSAFQSYADGLLDLIIPDSGGDPREVLFLGPDEGSAGLMDWAALHARRRGYPFWKSFTTGKPLSLGGIPHDRYGMTTRSVHTYVLGVLEKRGTSETTVRKIQTGGPDGDLGSNEILISHDTTIGIVDGSGVLYDPDGLNREELLRLAGERVMVEQFDRSLLGEKGFFVSVTDREVTLPNGTTILNGEDFRNNFHLTPYLAADLFVPCGGRPAAISIANWKNLLDENGRPRVGIIVEGANLFITQEARLRLEGAGVLVFKDASTNKGGVTSSSLEVFSGLILSDSEWEELMTLPPGGEESPFRLTLVEQIINRLESNARSEFELLWREHERSGRSFTLLSDDISARINRITDAVQQSALLADEAMRRAVISRYIPEILLEKVGYDAVVERAPKAYLDAIMAATLGAQFVYAYGLEATEVDFAAFLASW